MLIAQISDIHASFENDHLQRFEQVLRWLANLLPDIVVLTGDLTESEWREGYKQIAERLERQDYPSLVLPGNSDDRHLMRMVWGETQGSSDAPPQALNFSRDIGGLKLIGLDTTVDRQDYGSVSGHLQWLEKQLSNTGDSPALLFMHHHVFESGIPTLDESMCRATGPLEALIKNAPARLLAMAAGHVHRPVAGTFAGIPAYICGSVCPANPVWFGTKNIPPVAEPPALMIHRYVNNRLTSHHVCV